MKTIKKIINSIGMIFSNNKLKYSLLVIFLLTNGLLFAQIANPGGNPTSGPGMNAPLDGGLVVAILAGGGLIAAFFKKRNDKE